MASLAPTIIELRDNITASNPPIIWLHILIYLVVIPQYIPVLPVYIYPHRLLQCYNSKKKVTFQ